MNRGFARCWVPADLISYVGPEEAAALRAQLRKDAPQELIDFALTPGEIGSNRNLVLALTVGEHVLMLDDDVVSTTWSLAHAIDALRVVGHGDPRDWAFFKSRREAFDAAPLVDVDLLAAHEEWLGRSLRDVVSHRSSVDLGSACPHMVEALDQGESGIVLATFAGIAGDGARYCPEHIMFAASRIRAQLTTDERLFSLAMSSREIHRVASQPVVTHDSSFASYCVALSNCSLVPPFMPRGRNEDGVFGGMLALTFPSALFAHLSVGVFHDSDRASLYTSEPLFSAKEVRLCDHVAAALASVNPAASPVPPLARLRRLANALSELGDLSQEEYAEVVTDAVLTIRQRHLAQGHIFSGGSRHWTRALDQYSDAFVSRASTAAFLRPVDLSNESDGDASPQRYLAAMGALITYWPDILEHCGEMAACSDRTSLLRL